MTQKLFGALLKAQTEMEVLLPDSKNPHLKNEYASLAAVLKACRKALANNGLVLYQAAHTLLDSPPAVAVTSTIAHPESGESITEQLSIPLSKLTAQEVGSAITYGRRYLALAQTGLAPDDDDGNEASKAPAKTQQVAHNGNGAKPANQPAQAAKQSTTITETSEFKRLMAVGTETFGEDWNEARQWLVKQFTAKTTPQNVRESSKTLTTTECAQLADALGKHAAHYSAEWHKTKQTEAA